MQMTGSKEFIDIIKDKNFGNLHKNKKKFINFSENISSIKNEEVENKVPKKYNILYKYFKSKLKK